jgi:putative addiction module component (TIGR02574 family)
MSQAPISPSPFEELSLEDQIAYVETHLDSIIARLKENETIPEWHREILAERLAHYRSDFENAITWEEFEKELDQELAQG